MVLCQFSTICSSKRRSLVSALSGPVSKLELSGYALLLTSFNRGQEEVYRG